MNNSNRSILHKPSAAGTQGQLGQQRQTGQQDQQPTGANAQLDKTQSGKQPGRKASYAMKSYEQQEQDIDTERDGQAKAAGGLSGRSARLWQGQGKHFAFSKYVSFAEQNA